MEWEQLGYKQKFEISLHIKTCSLAFLLLHDKDIYAWANLDPGGWWETFPQEEEEEEKEKEEVVARDKTIQREKILSISLMTLRHLPNLDHANWL